MPEIRNAFDRVRVQAEPKGDSLTEQNHARSCDINTIMMRYEKSGVIDHISKYEEQYGDVSELDYKRSMDIIAKANSEYEALPAYVRDTLKIEQYLELMQTDEGVERLAGIIHPAEKYTEEGAPDPDKNQFEPEPPRGPETPDPAPSGGE